MLFVNTVAQIYHFDLKLNGSINSKRGIFSLLVPHGGAFEVSPGMGHCQKQLGLSEFKKSMWFHSNRCKYLHNCFHLRTKITTKGTYTVRDKVAVLAVKKLTPPWGICHNFKIKRQMSGGGGGWRTWN